MSDLLQSFLNILGFYNMSPSEYYSYYGDTYYILSRFQLFDYASKSDAFYIDVASQQIALEIQAAMDANTEFVVLYDYKPLLTGLGALQVERIIDSVGDSLEKKGYKVRDNWGEVGVTRITWQFKVFRMFRALPPTNPSI